MSKTELEVEVVAEAEVPEEEVFGMPDVLPVAAERLRLCSLPATSESSESASISMKRGPKFHTIN